MDRSLHDSAGCRAHPILQCKGPLVPHLRVRVVPPDLYLDYLALPHTERRGNREVEREPRLHAGRVLRSVNTVEYVLVQLCCEVASEPMNLSLFLKNWESH